MFKVIIEVAIWAIIIIGPGAVLFAAYHGLHVTAYDPSLSHNELWRFVFGTQN